MAFRLGEAVEYDPFSPEPHKGEDFKLGDPVDYDPFKEEEDQPGMMDRIAGYFEAEPQPDIAGEVAPHQPPAEPAETGLPEESEYIAAPGPLGEPMLKEDLAERPITPYEQAYQEEMAALEGEPEPDEDALESELRTAREAEETGEAPAEPEVDPKTGRPIIPDTEPWRWDDAKKDLKAWKKARAEKEKRHANNINEAKKSILRKDPDYAFPEGQGPWVDDPRELHQRKRGLDPSGQEIDFDARAPRDMTGEEKRSFANQFGSRMVPGAYTGIKRFEQGLYTTNYLLWVQSDKEHRAVLDSVVDQISKGAFPDDVQKQEAYKVRFAQEASDLWGSGYLIDDLIWGEAEKHGVTLKEDPLDITTFSNPPENMEETKKKNVERVKQVQQDIQDWYEKNPEYALPDDWDTLTSDEREQKYPGIFWGEQVSTNAINSLLSIGTYLGVQAATKNATIATLAAGLVLYPAFVQEIDDELTRLEQEEGIIVPDEIRAELALLGAIPSSMIEGLSERFGFGPGVMKHFKKLGQKALKRELIRRFVQSAMAKKAYTFAGKPTLWVAKQAPAGYAEEAGQTMVSNAAAQFVGSERSLFQGAGEAGRIGAYLEPMLGGPAAATTGLYQVRKKAKAKKEITKAENKIKELLQDYDGQTAEDILTGEEPRPAPGAPVEEPTRETEFTGAESVEAEETAAEFTPEELAAAEAAAPAEKPAPEPAAPRAPKPTAAPRMGEKPTAAVKRIWGVPEQAGGKRVAPGRTTPAWQLPAEKRPEEIQRVKEIWQGKRAPKRGGIIEDVSLPPAKTRITPTGRRKVLQNYANELGKEAGAKIRFDNVVYQDERPIGLQMTVTDGPAKGARFTISDRAHKTRAQAEAFVSIIVNTYANAEAAAPVLAPKKKAPKKDAQAELDQLVQTLNPEQKAAVKDLIEWAEMPIDQRLGLMRAELATLEQKKALKAAAPPKEVITKPAITAPPPAPAAAAPPTPPAAPPKVAPGEKLEPTAEIPGPSPGARWTTDPGAIPGEPLHFLDQTPNLLEDDSVAAIIEHEVEDGSLFELVDPDGRSLGMFKDAESAAQAAEEQFEAPKEKAPAKAKPVLAGGPRVAPVRKTPPGPPPAAPPAAVEKPAPEEKPLEVIRPPAEHIGSAAPIVTPQNPEGYDAEYMIVEERFLVPSHNPETWQKEGDYPEGVQERAYHSDTAEQAKVIEHAQKLDPRILLSDDPTPTNGPPIITESNYVISGNSRAMSIGLAFKDPKKAAKYKNQLVSKASSFGLAPKNVKAMDNPVLVRRIETENNEEMRKLAREFNETMTAGLGEAAEIASMGKSITPETMEKIGTRLADREISLRELLGKKDGLEIMGWLVDDGAISATQRTQYLNKAGDLLNKRGKETIESGIFGNIIDDLDLINSAQKSHLNKIEKSLAELAKVKARGEAWDITPDLKEGLRLATAAQAQDLSVREFLMQQPLFEARVEYTTVSERLADLIIKDKPTRFKERWKGYSIDAVADTKKQVQMFKPKTQAESLQEHFDIEAAEVEAPAEAPGEIEAAAAPEPTAAPEPAEITNYFSGANRLGDMKGHIQAGVPIGVEISELSKNGEALLIDYLKEGGQVFIDSGAFGAQKKGIQVNWPAVLKNYKRIADAAGDGAKNLVVVAPDVIGDPLATINMTGKYKRELNVLAEQGVGIILPVHRPPAPGKLRDIWANMIGSLDEGNRAQGIAGFPSQHKNPDRLNPEDYADIFKAFYPPKRVHLLGISPKADDFSERTAELRRLDPNIEIIADANRLRAQAGRTLKPEIYAAAAARKANEGQAKPIEEYKDLRPEYETREGFEYTFLPEGLNADKVMQIGKVEGLPAEFVREFLYNVRSGILGTQVNFAISEGEWRDDTMIPFKEFHDIISLGAEQIAPAMKRADMVQLAVEWEQKKADEREAAREKREKEAARKPPLEAPLEITPGQRLAERIRTGQEKLANLETYKLKDLVKAAQELGVRATGKKGKISQRIRKEAPRIQQEFDESKGKQPLGGSAQQLKMILTGQLDINLPTLEPLNKEYLQSLAIALGFPKSGTKDQISARIMDLKSLRDEISVLTEPEHFTERWSKPELKDMAAKAKVWKSGNKRQLAISLMTWAARSVNRGQVEVRAALGAALEAKGREAEDIPDKVWDKLGLLYKPTITEELAAELPAEEREDAEVQAGLDAMTPEERAEMAKGVDQKQYERIKAGKDPLTRNIVGIITKPWVQQLAIDLGLAKSGTRDQIVDRIIEAYDGKYYAEVAQAAPETIPAEGIWIEGHLQTPDRFDRWWTHLIRAREALNEIAKKSPLATEWLKGVDNTDLDSIVAAVDAYDEAQVEPPAAEAPAAPAEKAAPEHEKAAGSTKLANWVNNKLVKDESIAWRDLFKQADTAFAGTQAAGKYSPKDAYDAMEQGVNIYVHDQMAMRDPENAAENVAWLKETIAKLPTQTKRTREQGEFQQFSTPPPLAYVANWAANITENDTYLEPSAGVGGLAIFGREVVGDRAIVNELSPRRAALLGELGFKTVFVEDASQLDNVLPDAVKPTVIVMNPPFSATAGRLKGITATKFGAQQIEQALNRLEDGGRLVGIVGKGMADNQPGFKSWWKIIKGKYTVKANVRVSGQEYRKYGTTFDNQLIIIDKIGPTDYTLVKGKVDKIEDLIPKLEGVRNDRQEMGKPGAERKPIAGKPAGAEIPKAEQPGAEPGPVVDIAAGAVGPGARPGEVTKPAAGQAGRVEQLAPEPGKPIPEPEAVEPGRGEFPGTDTEPGERAGPGTIGNAAGVPTPTGGELSLDQLDSLIDEVIEAEPTKKKAAAPKKPAAAKPTATKKPASRDDAYKQIAGIIKALPKATEAKEIALAYGQDMTLEHPDAYEQAKPVIEFTYNDFIGTESATEEKARQWITDAYRGLSKYDIDPAIIKNWILYYYANDRPGALPKSKPAPTAAPAEATPEKKAEIKKVEKKREEISASLYEDYTGAVTGATKHPTPLVETAALADTDFPKLTYKVDLPASVLKPKKAGMGISDIQLEAVILAGQAHEQELIDGRRRGFFAGHGTGVGKGRIIGATIMDNWRKGRKKAVWISEKASLETDARRDLNSIGWPEGGKALFNLNKTKLGSKVKKHDQGIMFSTYNTLASQFSKIDPQKPETLKELRVRLNQIRDWLGEDYDGIIAFDESHNMANSTAQQGTMGKTTPAQKALAGIMLEELLPKARLVYVSATGATEVSNMAYLSRLGLWGEGTPFANQRQFVNSIAGSGLAAMEMIARSLKANGLYTAPSLSYDGVNYDRLEHDLTPDQAETYNTIARAWQVIMKNTEKALDITNGNLNGAAKRAAHSKLWGTQQRVFNQIITAMQLPTMIAKIEKDIAAGDSAVIQLVNTNDAQAQRAMANRKEGEEIEDLDFTPRASIGEYLRKAFPTDQFETYLDDEGRVRTRPVTDADGQPVQNREAIELREKMLQDLRRLAMPDSPLDQLLENFGQDQVAEMTGRKSRVIIDSETGTKKEQKWSKSKALKDVDAFTDDKKRILVFSEAGGTGASYHADRTFKNRRTRRHYLLQAGWTASKAVQGLGRTHRSNQKQPPEYFLVTTNLKAQKRFISSIARRLDQLGALTKGQRQAGSQGIFQARDNLESDYARDALRRFWEQLADNEIEGMTWQQWEEQSGTKIVDPQTGALYAQTPDMIRTMNRMLSMEIDSQNIAFDAFSKNLDAVIQEHADAGTLDVGIETITGLAVEKVSEKVVHTVDETGSTANYVRVKVTNPSNKVAWESVRGQPIFQNVRSGKVWAGSVRRSRTTKQGAIINYRVLRSTADTTQRADEDVLQDPKKWQQMEDKPAQEEWNKQFTTIPETSDRTIDMLTGDLLPIWDRLTGFATVYRLQTDAGERLLGRVLAPHDVDTVLERLGVTAEKVEVKNKDLGNKILAGGRATLANGWEIKKSMVSGDERIELIGPRGSEIDLLEKQGAFVEEISFRDRIFIPTTGTATIFDRILVNRPVVKMITAYQGPRIADTEVSEPTAELAQKVKKKVDAGGKISQLDMFTGTDFETLDPIPEGPQYVTVKSTGKMGFESNVIADVHDAAAFAAPLADMAQEKGFMISTDAQGEIIEVHFIGKGGRSSVGIPLVETVGRLFNTPGVAKAYFIHNHPSGRVEPSAEDRGMARNMGKIAATGGIEMDQAIIAGDEYATYKATKTQTLASTTKKIRKTTRKKRIPVVERVIKRKGPGKVIANSNDAREHIKDVYGDRQGFMFLDTGLRDIGFLEFKPGTPARQLVHDLIQEGERINATGFLFHSKSESQEMPADRFTFLKEWQKQIGSGAMQLFEILHNGVSYADAGAFTKTGIIGKPDYQADYRIILSDVPIYASKKIAPTTPQTVEDVNLMVNAVTAQWTRGGPAIKVYRTQEGLPNIVKDYLKGENREADIITGAYYDNTIYLVAENLGSNEETTQTILHEGFGHHGLRGTLGKDVFPVLRDLYIAKKAEVNAIGAELGINTKTVDGQLQAAEEWFANQAQLGIESKWYDRLVRAIRNWIRKIANAAGIDMALSDPEIRALIAAARQFTLAGQKVSAHPGATPAFKKKKYGKRIDYKQHLTPEQQRRIKAAKGVGTEGFIEKRKEDLKRLAAERQHFPELTKVEDPTLRHQLADILRVHQEIPEVAKQQTAEKMREFIKDLSTDAYDVYTMNIILADMIRDIETGLLNNQMLGKGETFPFGFESVEQIAETHEKFKTLANVHPEIGTALRERKAYIDEMARQLVKFKILKKEVLKHNDYYHHQVLQYWGTKEQKGKGVATGSADVRQHWRPWMAARKGSLLDYNTEYVEAEFVALSQQYAQVETAKTLQRLKNKADIYADLKDQAKRKNLVNFYKQEAEKLSKMFKTTITPAEVMADHELDPLFQYRQAIAMSINALEGMAYKGKLGGDSEWQEIIDGLAIAHEDKKEDREGVFSPIPDGRLFDFLAYLVRTGQPGASWAATIFKNIHGRSKHIEDALGKNFLTWKTEMPAGYVEWKPEPGKGWYWANTLADQVLQQVIAGERDLQDTDVRQVLAKGHEIIWVLPEGLAETLDNFKQPPELRSIGRMSEAALRAWKQYILINPLRVIRYNLNNMSGDLDITLAYNPRILKHFFGAIRDLRRYGKGTASGRLKTEMDLARKLGVIGSGWSVQEVEDITKQMGLDKFVRNIIMGQKPNLAVKYWEAAKNATTFRENILRLAAFRHFKKEVKKGKGVYGASKRPEIDAITDPTERAAKLARELVGDYGNISHSGQWIRKRMMPFYSWMEINSPRYVYMLRNVRHEGRKPGQAVSRMGIKALTKTAGFGVKTMMLYTLVQIWNHLLYPDEEKEFGEAGRRQLHLILGRRDDGTIRSIRFQGALSDTLSFFGLEDWPDDVRDIYKSEDRVATVQEKLIEVPKAFSTRLYHGVRPEPKLLFEGLSGYSFYPDPYSPRPIRDTAQHILRTFSLDKIYNRAVGKPGRGKNVAMHFLNDLKSLLIYTSDPGEQAYYDVRNMVIEHKKKTGDERPSGRPTNKGNALYYYRQALKYGDFEAAERYLVKYYEYGGKRTGIKASIKRAHPLSGIKKMQRRSFRKDLSPAEQKTLERAIEWYDKTYRQPGSRDIRIRARKTYREKLAANR
jgi:hypothetical protein